jgi:hypothetical protein
MLTVKKKVYSLMEQFKELKKMVKKLLNMQVDKKIRYFLMELG